MDHLERFWEAIKKEEACLLATSDGERVTMRTVSPVYHEDAILLFTDPKSLKYRQLQKNPNCCLAIGGLFLEARVEFEGPTMSEKNAALRTVYAGKFSDAFDEGVEHGGRGSEFIILRPIRLTGWTMESGAPMPMDVSF